MDDRIHAATVAVLRRTGFERMTIDAVAASAAVGKAAVYRRYSSKEDLVVGAVRAVLPVAAPEDAGGPDALAAIVEDLRAALFDVGGVGLLPLLLTASSDTDTLPAVWRREIVGPRVALVERMLRSTTETSDADPRLIGELALGGLIARHISRGPVTAVDAQDLAHHLWRFALGASRQARSEKAQP